MRSFEPGDVLFGFCGGFFGRDSHGPKTIEAIGKDWVVVREEDGSPNVAFFTEQGLSAQEFLNEYCLEA